MDPFLLQIAPMIDVSHRHCRFFWRLLHPSIPLTTEMITANAVIHGDRQQLLGFAAKEKPLTVQLAGAEPGPLGEATRIVSEFAFAEINLNVGCPSDRVQAGRFGACLMKEPALVAQLVATMKSHSHLPISVKTRIGIDHQDDYDFLAHFVELVAKAGCNKFIIHARKAWLHGLSPKQNREVPPLDYQRVYAIKKAFPELTIIINGGLCSIEQINAQRGYVDGVMLGRVAQEEPYFLAHLAHEFLQIPLPSREQVAMDYYQYCLQQAAEGHSLGVLIKQLFQLYKGQPGAKQWRQLLTDYPNKGLAVVPQAIEKMQSLLAAPIESR